MGYQSKVTSKGQTTIPQEVREYLRLKPGDRINYVLDNGLVRLIPKNRNIADLAGFLGKPPKEMLKAQEAVLEGLEAGMAVAKPGYTCGEIADAFFGVLKKYGVEKTSRAGYSVGLSYPPDWGEHTMSIRPGDPSVLRTNMVFHFMPAIWTPDWGLEITETMRISDEGGPECLANVPRELCIKS